MKRMHCESFFNLVNKIIRRILLWKNQLFFQFVTLVGYLRIPCVRTRVRVYV